MTTQLLLGGFDDRPRITTGSVLAARNDPGTSHAAGREINRSGHRESLKRKVLQGVHQHPGKTSRELAQLLAIDRHECAKRLPDLSDDGLVRRGSARKCSASPRGLPAVVWWLTAAGLAVLNEANE